MSDDLNASTATTATTIELNAEREIVLTGNSRDYRVFCRRIDDAAWDRYFSAIVVAAVDEGDDRINTLDIQTARLQLAQDVVLRESGYQVKGGADLSSLPDWQRLLPLEHRLAIGSVLASARPIETKEDTIYPEGTPVTLGCTWTASADGSMTYVSGLVHVLESPTEQQHRRYMREASRTRVLGGDRRGETIYPGAQHMLAELYDELIVSVEGYTCNGEPLIGRSNIAREMDKHHKVMAAQEIFQPRRGVQLKVGAVK